MSMNHHGEVFADKCYTIETLTQVLGLTDTRTVRGYFAKGLKRRRVGAKTYIAGTDFIRWVERGDECPDDDDNEGSAA